MPRFAIVEFEDKSVAVILDSWFVGDEETSCLWPNLPATRVPKLVKSGQQPCSSWQKLTVRVLGKAGTFERALEKLKMSEETSDINTDLEEVSRKRRRIKTARALAHQLDSSSEEENEKEQGIDIGELPSPPLPPTPGNDMSDIDMMLSTLEDQPPRPPSPVHKSTPIRTGTPTTSEGERTYVVGERLMKKLLTIALDNQETLRIHTGLLQNLTRRSNLVTNDVTMPEGLVFPLDTLEELSDIDVKLIDPAVAGGLVNVLGDLGGRTLDECTKRTMGYIISTSLCLRLNMWGRNDKRAFGTTNLFQVVYRSVKRNPETSTVTKKDVEKAVSKWLIGGRDRDGNRAKRAQKPKQPPPTL